MQCSPVIVIKLLLSCHKVDRDRVSHKTGFLLSSETHLKRLTLRGPNVLVASSVASEPGSDEYRSLILYSVLFFHYLRLIAVVLSEL